MHVALALSMLCFLKESSAVTWYPLDNREYYVAIEASRSINFNESRDACVRLNASLAKVNTSAIQDLVANHTVDNKGFYIGLMRTSFDGTFQWLDGTPLAYSHWFNGEPDNGGKRQGDERCTSIGFHWRNSSMWNDLNCNIKLGGYICQRIIDVATKTSQSAQTPTIVSKSATTQNAADNRPTQNDVMQNHTAVIVVLLLLLMGSICINVVLLHRQKRQANGFKHITNVAQNELPTKKSKNLVTEGLYEVPMASSSHEKHVYVNTIGPKECSDEDEEIGYVKPNPVFPVQGSEGNDPGYVEFKPPQHSSV